MILAILIPMTNQCNSSSTEESTMTVVMMSTVTLMTKINQVLKNGYQKTVGMMMMIEILSVEAQECDNKKFIKFQE